MNKERRAVLIHPDDNVAVVLQDVIKGEEVRYWERERRPFLVAQDSIAKGHKVAIRSIAKGAAVVKYGLRIGTASKQIKKGQLVHIHNLVSFAREGGS